MQIQTSFLTKARTDKAYVRKQVLVVSEFPHIHHCKPGLTQTCSFAKLVLGEEMRQANEMVSPWWLQTSFRAEEHWVPVRRIWADPVHLLTNVPAQEDRALRAGTKVSHLLISPPEWECRELCRGSPCPRLVANTKFSLEQLCKEPWEDGQEAKTAVHAAFHQSCWQRYKEGGPGHSTACRVLASTL